MPTESQTASVGTYSGDVRQGGRYIYSVRKDEKKVATFELGRGDDNKIHLGQIRGKQNKRVPAGIEKAVRKWFRNRKRIQGDKVPEIERPKSAGLNKLAISMCYSRIP